MRFLILAGIWIFSFSAIAKGAIYYVDPLNGNDANTGLSETLAWESFANISSKSFSPGDTICLKKGGVWNQQLDTPKGGTQSQPVKITSYGSGSLPTIDRRGEGMAVNIITSHIVVEHIKSTATCSTCAGMGDGNAAQELNNVTLKDCEIYGAYNAVNMVKSHGIFLKNLYVFGSKNNGIRFGGSPWKVSDAVVEDCRVIKTNGNDTFTIHEGVYNNVNYEAGSYFTFRNCYAEGANENGFDLTTGSDILLYNCESRACGQGGVMVGHSAKRVTIDRFRSYDEPTATMSAAANFGGANHEYVVLKNSILQGNGYHLLLVSTNNVFIYNNHFVWGGGSEIFDTGISSDGSSIDNLTVKNNVFTTNTTSMGRIRFLDKNRPPSHPTFYFDHNIYYAPNADTPKFLYNSVNYNFTNYRAAFGVEPHSFESDPGFADRTEGNFELTANSPARNRGLSIQGVNTDFKGVARPQGSGYDIGAYEYIEAGGSPPPAPEGLVIK